MIDSASAASPLMSLTRLYPSISFIANNRAYARDLVAALGAQRRVRDWGALITQETLGDHELIAATAKNKCRILLLHFTAGRHPAVLGKPRPRGTAAGSAAARSGRHVDRLPRLPQFGRPNSRSFARNVHKDPAALVGRRELARKARREVLKSHGYQPIATLASIVDSRRVLRLSCRSAEDHGRSYLGGDDVLDPQYEWRPADLSEPDRRRFFDPIRITEADGSPAPWLKDARPPDRKLRL